MHPISAETRICAVIGNPVGHSLSPTIHNAAFAALDLDFIYLACPVEDVRGALAGMRAFKNFRGLSVTIPHKMEVLKHVDEVAEVDRSIGAINTIIQENGRLIGHGTDGPGALKALREGGVDPAGRRILILGAGGAARAIAFTLAKQAEPAEMILLDIDEKLLRGLRADLAAGADTPIQADLLRDGSLAGAMARADIIINCTSVGMHPKVDVSLIPPALFRPGQAVFDVVYTPLRTKLLAEAQACGLKVISGVEMFINQAVLQFKLFTGLDAPAEVMRRVVMERLTV